MATAPQIEVPSELQGLVSGLSEQVTTGISEITNQEQYEGAAEQAKSIKKKMDEIESEFKIPIAKANEAHKALIALKNKFWQPRSIALTMLRGLMGKYEQDQE